MKKCASKTCKQENPQPLVNFWKNRTTKDSLSIHCKVCNKEHIKKTGEKYKEKYNAQKKVYREKNKDRFKKLHRIGLLRREYGLTIDQFDEMFSSQGGCCKICGTHSDKFERGLCVDHCHVTGKVRGLLCMHCNHMLGSAMDKIENLQSGIEYLKDSK